MVAEALGTFGDIEKRPRNSLQSSTEGNLHNRRSKSATSSSQSEWQSDAPPSPSAPGTPPRRRKQDMASSQDGNATPPLSYSHSPAVSMLYCLLCNSALIVGVIRFLYLQLFYIFSIWNFCFFQCVSRIPIFSTPFSPICIFGLIYFFNKPIKFAERYSPGDSILVPVFLPKWYSITRP